MIPCWILKLAIVALPIIRMEWNTSYFIHRYRRWWTNSTVLLAVKRSTWMLADTWNVHWPKGFLTTLQRYYRNKVAFFSMKMDKMSNRNIRPKIRNKLIEIKSLLNSQACVCEENEICVAFCFNHRVSSIAIKSIIYHFHVNLGKLFFEDRQRDGRTDGRTDRHRVFVKVGA